MSSSVRIADCILHWQFIIRFVITASLHAACRGRRIPVYRETLLKRKWFWSDNSYGPVQHRCNKRERRQTDYKYDRIKLDTPQTEHAQDNNLYTRALLNIFIDYTNKCTSITIYSLTYNPPIQRYISIFLDHPLEVLHQTSMYKTQMNYQID